MYPLKLIFIICILSITFTSAFGFALSTNSDSNLSSDDPSPKSSLATLNTLGLTPTNAALNANLGLAWNPTLTNLTNKKNGVVGGNNNVNMLLCRSQSIPPTSWTIQQHRQCALACINSPTPSIGGQCTADGVCTCTALDR